MELLESPRESRRVFSCGLEELRKLGEEDFRLRRPFTMVPRVGDIRSRSPDGAFAMGAVVVKIDEFRARSRQALIIAEFAVSERIRRGVACLVGEEMVISSV